MSSGGAGRALAAVAGALVLALFAAGGALGIRQAAQDPVQVVDGAEPHGDPSPTAEPTDPPASPTDPAGGSTEGPSPGEQSPTSPAPEESFDPAILGEITDQVAEVRRLPPSEPVDGRVLDDQALADKVGQLIAEEQDPEQLETDRRILAALRLIPADLDLGQLLDDLYREQVAGLYVPEEDVLYVGGGVGAPSALQRSVLAHEITHALQDQHFDLEAFVDLPDDQADEQLARIALVEGDATLTQQLWGAGHLTLDQQTELLDEAFEIDTSVLDDAPDAIARSLAFPYVEGAQFAVALFQQGGVGALDAAFAAPPATTEHILHPDTYRAGEPAIDISAPAQIEGAWNEIERSVVGEFDLQLIFDALGAQRASSVGAGWGGGQLAAWDRDGQTALAIALAFDTPEDATEACQSVPAWYEQVAAGAPAGAGLLQGDQDWLAFTCSGQHVSFGVGPDEATARSLLGG